MTITPHLRKAKAFDPFILAPNLREADKRELQAATGKDQLYSLMHGFHASNPCYTILSPDDESIIGMCGVVPQNEVLGVAWCVFTDDVMKHKRKFLTESVKIMDQFNDNWPILTNCVDERNTLHVAWLQSIGAVFVKRHKKFGAEQRPFLEFVRINHV